MAIIPGSVTLAGFIAPTDSTDTYPVSKPIYGLGGLRTVSATTERDAITTQRREVGMIVYVSGTSEYYKLESGLTNSDWVLLNIGSGTSLTGYFLSLSGGTVTGNTYFTQGLSASTFSAGTIYSGSTDLYDIFTTGAHTHVQNGLNTYTGGTASAPTVNISAATLSYLSATTISGDTLYSGSTNLYDIFLQIGNSGITGSFIPLTGTGLSAVTGDIAIDDAVNLSWNGGNETLQYNPVSTNIELTTSNGFDVVTGAILSAGTDLYSIFSTTSGATGFSGWTSSTGINSIIANNGSGNLASGNFAIVGGSGNTASGPRSVVVGGSDNTASSGGTFIGGGRFNMAVAAGASVVGGQNNMSSGQFATVLGGSGNTATTIYGAIINGVSNKVTGPNSFISNGVQNNITGQRSAIIGGQGITGTSNDTVYVPYLNIQSATTNNALTSILVKDVNGDVYLRDVSSLSGLTSGITGNFIPMSGTGLSAVTGDIAIDDAVNLSWNGGNETLQYNPGSTNIELTTSNGFDVVTGAILSAGTDLYNIFLTTAPSGTTGFSGWTSSTGINSIVANNGTANLASGNFSIVGGSYNSAVTLYSTVINGINNLASGYYSFIGNGYKNSATTLYSFVGNGFSNQASGQYVAIVNGNGNKITGNYSLIGAGSYNIIKGAHSSIVGGDSNYISTFNKQFIGGGLANSGQSGYAVVVGGRQNLVSGYHGAILNGRYNTSLGQFSSIIGGGSHIVSGNRSAIIAGSGITATSDDTVYVPFLNIQSATTNNTITSVLVRDVNGDIYLSTALSGSGGNFIPMTGTGINLVTGDIAIDDAINLSWNGGNETLQYNPVSTNIELTTSNGFDVVTGAILSAGTDLYSIFLTTAPSGSTGFSGWTSSTGINSIIANNGSGNLASGNYSIIGGSGNTASGNNSFIGNGYGNTALGNYTTILNGSNNLTIGYNSTVLNGKNNTAYGYYSFIAGGNSNYAYGLRSVIINGTSNSAMTESSFIGLGFENKAYGALGHSIIVGGYKNVSSGGFSFNGSGRENRITGDFSSIVNGRRNKAYGNYSFIGGGGGYFAFNGNSATTNFATIINGQGNLASGTFSFIANGSGHTVSGQRSAIIGGHSITGTSNDTVYVPFLNIQSANTNNALTKIVVRDANGDIYLRDASTLSGGTSGSTGFSGWTASSGIHSIIANNGSGNVASGNFSTVGGYKNSASGKYSFIGNGYSSNTISNYTAIVGGLYNSVSGNSSFIGGGRSNKTTGPYNSIVGGFNNKSYGSTSAIGGGTANITSGNSSFIGGGFYNNNGGGFSSVIVGGLYNTITGGYSFIGGGGGSNFVSGNWSSIISGILNSATTNNSMVVGGRANRVSGTYSSIINGSGNTVSGTRSAIIGGINITGTSNDTVYVPYLNIQSAPTNNTLTNIVVRNANGDIYLRDASTLSGSSNIGNFLPLSGGTVTGNTIFTAGLSSTTTSQASLNVNIFNLGSPTNGNGDVWFTYSGTSVFLNVNYLGNIKTVELT